MSSSSGGADGLTVSGGSWGAAGGSRTSGTSPLGGSNSEETRGTDRLSRSRAEMIPTPRRSCLCAPQSDWSEGQRRGASSPRAGKGSFFLSLVPSHVSIRETGVNSLPTAHSGSFRAQKHKAQSEAITCLGPYRHLVVELQDRLPPPGSQETEGLHEVTAEWEHPKGASVPQPSPRQRPVYAQSAALEPAAPSPATVHIHLGLNSPGKSLESAPGWTLAASARSRALRRISCCRPASETPTCGRTEKTKS